LNSTRKKDQFEFEKLEVIKRYFSRIYTVLSKEVRDILLKLDVSQKEFKEIMKSLAFLPEEKQKAFLDEIMDKGND
jgi:hypothetical protein